MALKYIDSAWKSDMRTNYAHRFNFYINPRCRVFPALTSTGVSYVRNTSGADNMRGTFRLQAGASTSLTYLYTMPQRFIVEGWVKPEFAYDVAGNQTLFRCGDAAEFSIIYNATTDKIDMIQSPGTTISTRAFTATTDLYAWLYIRAWYDNVGKLAGLYVVKNGEELVATQNVPGVGSFVPLNTISFFPGVACQSSYWCIHELDETLATGAWKTYQADRQVMFDFNGTTLSRERIRIPVNHEATDTRGVKSFSLSKSVASPMSGNPCANMATMTLYNVNGQFSDDQYDAFDPFQGRYNGTQKYLQNRVGVEIESQYGQGYPTRDSSLIGYWSMDGVDTSGSALYDNSGNGNHGTIYGATPVDGVSGRALSFDGVNDYVQLQSMTIDGDFTISLWYRSDGDSLSGATGYNTLFGNSGLSRLLHSRGNYLYAQMGAGSHQSGIALNGVLNHVAYVYKSSTMTAQWYVNGQQSGNPLIGGIALTGAYKIGAYSTTNYMMNGIIDEPRIYNRALSADEVAYLYTSKVYTAAPSSSFLYPGPDLYPSDSLYPMGPLNTSAIEPLFIGRTTPGAFKRTSESRYFGTATIEAEDGISELGETRLPKAYTFDTYDLSDPASETTSLVHAITRLVTKKEIRNFALNSSFENATIGNSWTASGLTLTRDSTYAQFGTYAAKAVAGSAGQYFRQVIKFETLDKIDVGDTFNFSAFVRQGTASTVKIQIEELDTSGTLLGSASETACGTDTGVFTRVNVSRTILSSSCTQLRITFYATGASTFYVDGAMLTRGTDALDYFLVNATDGASGSGSADSAATYLYDTVAIDAEAVDVSVPWAELEKGDTPWSHLKDIGDASLASYVGMEPDGVLSFRVRYNSLDEDNNGSVADIASIGTSLDATSINSVDVRGVQTAKEPWTMQLYSAYTSGQWVDTTGTGMTAGGRLYYPIADGTLCTVNGSSEIECPYVDAGDAKSSWTPK